MSTFLRKLSSRKLWAAVAAVVCSLAVAISGSELTPEVVTALQSAVGALIAYIFGEGAVDVARLVTAAKTTTEEPANDR